MWSTVFWPWSWQIFTATSAVIITKYIKIEIIKEANMAQDIKNEEVEEVQEEEVGNSWRNNSLKSLSWLGKRRWVRKQHLRAHAETSNAANEERQNLQIIVARLGKAIFTISRQPLSVICSWRFDRWWRRSGWWKAWFTLWKKKELKKSQQMANLTITTIWPSKFSSRRWTPVDTIAQVQRLNPWPSYAQ